MLCGFESHPAVTGSPCDASCIVSKFKESIEAKGADMRIGIIGAGHIGGTLTRRFSALGHEVFVANSRGPDSLATLATETGATAVSVKEAAPLGGAWTAAIPLKKIASLPPAIVA